MSYLFIFACAVLGCGIVVCLIPFILKAFPQAETAGYSLQAHHTHRAPIPRFGGLALAVAFVGIFVFSEFFSPVEFAGPSERFVVLFGPLAMFFLGFWDDLKPLGAKIKLAGQILIAGGVWCSGIGIQCFQVPFLGKIISLDGAGGIITVAWLVSMTNLINLIDGVDGLAGGISLMLMGLLAFMGHQTGAMVALAAGMAGAILGFLRFNFPPARIYLGDGGAYLLGFQVGLFAILNSHKGTVAAALVAPLFVLALPIVDTILAILRRGLRGLPVFRPDRRHLHHHMLGMGFSRRKVVLSFYVVTLIFLVLGLAAFLSHGGLVPVLLGIGATLLLACAGKLNFSREWFSVGRVVGNSWGMRREVQYALSLTWWLILEGDRHASVEELWPDLVFAARRLGFTSVRLTSADGSLNWQQPESSQPSRSRSHELLGGHFGILELKAPCHAKARPADHCFRLGDNAQLFDILGEVLADGWVQAVKRCKHRIPAHLEFDARVIAQEHPPKPQPAMPFVTTAEPLLRN